MTHNLIHTKGYLLVVDDSEIKEGDYLYSFSNNKVVVANKLTDLYVHSKKIIAHLPLNNSPILEGVDLLPLLPQHDVEKKAEKFIGCKYDGIEDSIDQIGYDSFIRGYNQAIEDNKDRKYTEEDISVMVNNAVVFAESNTHLSVGEYARQFKDFYDKCIQSLDLPKIPIAFECEIKCFEEEYLKPLRQVSITTPKGHTQWVGKYIY